jgi:putative membrane protein
MSDSLPSSASPRAPVLREAEFNPKVRTYWLLNGTLILLVTIIGIPLLPFWLALGHWVTGRYLARMRCTLTRRTLEFSKGMLVRTEKTVPLDKITDVGMVQGPVMRFLDLQALSVETAGQSSAGPLLKLVGVVDTQGFREAVLEQRDRMVEKLSEEGGAGAIPASTPAAADDDGESRELLTEIRDALLRIEAGMEEERREDG